MWFYGVMCVVVTVVGLGSCEDSSVEHVGRSSRVSFAMSIDSTERAATRSAAECPRDTVIELRGGTDPLYLQVSYKKGIENPRSSEKKTLTRGTPVTNDNMYDSFGVTGFKYTGSWTGSETPNFFSDETATKTDNNIWELSDTYYWLGGAYNMQFFAYAPKGNSRYIISGAEQQGAPTLTVDLAGGAEGDVQSPDTKDLLVGQSGVVSGEGTTPVALSMKHAMCAVRLELEASDLSEGNLCMVSMTEVYSKGTYNMMTETWSDLQNALTFYASPKDETGPDVEGTINVEGENTFMVIPQTLGDDALLGLWTNDWIPDVEISLAGIELPMGTTVTLKVTKKTVTWENTLTVPEKYEWDDWSAGSGNIARVYSYRSSSEGTVEAVPWTLKCSTDGGESWGETLPDWLGLSKTSGDGSTSGETIGFTIKKSAELVEDETHTNVLKNAEQKGYSDMAPYDLAVGSVRGSTGLGVGTTANCYVVNAPGYYCFPLVYGNAYSDYENTSAYTSTSSGSTVLSPFVNHLGNEITSGMITGNGITPSTAELLWQDAKGLVTDVEYNTQVGYEIGGVVSFYVDKETIRQGNAVIALKDASGNIIWSWHIWVTDHDLSAEAVSVTNYTGTTYKMMSVNLGWCDPQVKNYDERSCLLKFSAEGAEDQIMTFKCLAGQIVHPGNAPYYEWGRKDPFYPSAYAGSTTTKTWYSSTGSSSTANPGTNAMGTGKTCLMNYILNPTKMNSSEYGDNTYYNLWSVNNTATTVNGNKVVKTIYDPCPEGFHVPASNAFTGFTTTGVTASSATYVRGTWNSTEYGYYFYTNTSKSSTIFFPVLGVRSSGDSGIGQGTIGYCWTAGPYSGEGYSYFLLYRNDNYVNPVNSTGKRGRGMGIRPVAD